LKKFVISHHSIFSLFINLFYHNINDKCLDFLILHVILALMMFLINIFFNKSDFFNLKIQNVVVKIS